MAFLFDRMKLVVEPSGAVGVAALLAGRIARRADRSRALRRERRSGAVRRAACAATEKPARSTSTTVRSAAATSASPPRHLPEHPAGQAARRCRRRTRSLRAPGRGRRGTRPLSWPRSMMRRIASIGFTSSPMRVLHLRAARDLAHEHAHDVGRVQPACGAGSPRRGAAARDAGSSPSSTAWMRSSSTPQFSRNTVSRTSSFDEK